MSLSDLASLGSFVSGVAVLVSLVFLYHQLRQIAAQIQQADRNQRASIREERTSRTVSALNAYLDPAIIDCVFDGNIGSETMTPTQIRQYFIIVMGRLNNVENAYSQHLEGLLDRVAFDQVRASLKAALATPGFRAMWQIVRPQFEDRFVAYIVALLADTPALYAEEDMTVRWRSASATERAKAQLVDPWLGFPPRPQETDAKPAGFGKEGRLPPTATT
jgi:hypothetical protein